MKYIIMVLIFLFCSITRLLPTLNGTTTPIVLANSYTFTNFEVAKGFVQFKNGFSVASTNTAILDVNFPIQGTINLNSGGTIIMNGDLLLGEDCTISGTGYIKTRGHELVFSKENITLAEPIHFFGDDVFINGNGIATLKIANPGGALNFKQVTNVTFKNITLFIENPSTRILFPSTNLTALNFYSSNIIFSENSSLTVGTTNLLVRGNCSFAGKNATMTVPTKFEIDPVGNFELQDFATLAVNNLDIGGVESVFTLNNQTTLQFTKLTTTGIAGNGRFLIRGKTRFKANNTTVSMTGNQNLLVDAGGRLVLENIRLRIN